MYVNQIDNIIDQILNNLYFEILQNKTLKIITEDNKINYVEYNEQINNFINDFIKNIDTTDIHKLINNKENLQKIMDIIKRYIAYYCFFYIAFYYKGTLKDYRNNLIQYSKLQENSTFNIKNFFDTENNYQLIRFYKIIKDVSQILMMSELQKKALNVEQYKDSINFLKNLGEEYINNYILMITNNNEGELVEINVHNLLKTIVFGEIYQSQEQKIVFEILNEIEENEYEYTYINVVVSNEEIADFNTFRQIFVGEEDGEIKATDLYELVNVSNTSIIESLEKKISDLLNFNFITPIVDNFLRYHRDTERLEVDSNKQFTLPLINGNNAKNIQLALLYQQRKKKENTKAQLIVNKIDMISDFYSENVKNNQKIKEEIKKYFQGPLSYRKAVLTNYLEEVHVMNKNINQGKRAIQSNEYFLELKQAIGHAYFNFKDFQKYGMNLNIETDNTINLLRYSNIEFKNQLSYQFLDMMTAINDNNINLVGYALGPFINGPIQCIKKEHLIDIRDITIKYNENDEIKTLKTDNGYKMFLMIIKHFYIATLKVRIHPIFELYNDFSEISKLNNDIFNKVIYWIYDIEKDKYKIDTYENIKSYNYQDVIRFMNSKIYDKLIKYLNEKLIQLINDNKNLPLFKIQNIIEFYLRINKLPINNEYTRNLIINEYLHKKKNNNVQIKEIKTKDKIPIPEYKILSEKQIFKIKINMLNPLNPKEYVNLKLYSSTKTEENENIITTKCQHENEWAAINKLKKQNLNKYNMAMSQFIEEYVLETTSLDFICRICGQILSIKQYVQDGTYDNNTQKFITAYVPLDIPLEEINEYKKYQLTIRYLDTLINRISLITGTSMLIGQNIQIKQKRKALVKNIIDIIIKHNYVNLKKNIPDEQRLEFFSNKFNIVKDMDNVFFFELDDKIFNFIPNGDEIGTDINRLKFNNILLYFIIIFITELNGAQISMMVSDKIGNIYTFLKYGPKIFDNLLIKKSVNDNDTIPIINYPILCYLIFIISYLLIKYKLWYYPENTNKSFNPISQKIIINSLVDLINSIIIDAHKLSNDYIYLLTVSKFYTQLNNTFKNNDIINILKQNHTKYFNVNVQNTSLIEKDLNKTYSISNPIKLVKVPRKIPSYNISSGIQLDKKDNIIYKILQYNTDITNCPNGPIIGGFHYWKNINTNFICIKCNKKDNEVYGDYDSTIDNYYYNLQSIATRRGLDGHIHDFVLKNGKYICSIDDKILTDRYNKKEIQELKDHLNEYLEKIAISGADKDKITNYINKLINEKTILFTKDELNILNNSLNKIEDDNTKNILKYNNLLIKEEEDFNKIKTSMLKKLTENYKTFTNGNLFGNTSMIIDKLITSMESYIGKDIIINIDKYPVYLMDNVYIIDHAYNGALFTQPIIFTQKDNKIFFKENQSFFKTDVYYYTDNRTTHIDVYYDAISLELLGYKEKHKDYVLLKNSNNYLIINLSIRNRLLIIGHKTQYIDVKRNFDENKKYIKDEENINYFQILDNLIRDHIYKMKHIIDNIISILYKVKNFDIITEEEILNLVSSQTINAIINKFSKQIENINFISSDNLNGIESNIFDDWNDIRDLFIYEKINWSDINIKISENMYINCEIINYYDISSNIILYYFIDRLLLLINNINERNDKINIIQLVIEIINYVFNLYNIDKFKNILQIKRFNYILDGSELLIDLLKKGQGNQESIIIENQLNENEPDIDELSTKEKEELEDLKEEADALDVEADYDDDDNDDYAEGGDYDV